MIAERARLQWVAIAVLCVAFSTGKAAEISLSEKEVSTAIEPVSRAIKSAEERLADLPAAQTDGEKLVRMAEVEQAARAALAKVDFGRYSETEKRQIWAAIAAQIQPIDQANQKALLAMVPSDGWFAISRYGPDGAKAAFLIVQHGDQALWRRFLPAIERMAKVGEAEGSAYALMYDRLALSEGRPQRFGSQMDCRGGRYVPSEPLEDPQDIDRRRMALGMKPYKEYLKLFERDTC